VSSRLLTTRQVAERLALSPETILRRVRAGELPAFRIASNALRFDPDAIEAFLERSAVPSKTTPSVESMTKGENTHE
jgi:excisionase family DNA binding protein